MKLISGHYSEPFHIWSPGQPWWSCVICILKWPWVIFSFVSKLSVRCMFKEPALLYPCKRWGGTPQTVPNCGTSNLWCKHHSGSEGLNFTFPRAPILRASSKWDCMPFWWHLCRANLRMYLKNFCMCELLSHVFMLIMLKQPHDTLFHSMWLSKWWSIEFKGYLFLSFQTFPC